MVTRLSVSDGRQQYELWIKTDGSFDPRHDKKENLTRAAECFAHTAFLARWELCHGLVRGGVSRDDAARLPRTYFDAVFRYFEALASFQQPRPKPPDCWDILTRWEPEPNRFRLWFGVDWNQVPAGRVVSSFRHTILGTLLGLLGNGSHLLHLNTGESGVLGWSKPAHYNRYLLDPAVYGQVDPRLLISWANSGHFDGDFELHPYFFQDFALGLVHVYKRHNPTPIRLKRPTKRSKSKSTEWNTQICHTLFHEASHHYGMTLDYFYLSWDPGTLQIRTWCDVECLKQLGRSYDEFIDPQHGVGQTCPSFPSHPAVARDHLSLANADSVAAYLMGYRSADEYVIAHA